MSDIICVTNRRLCRGDFLKHMRQLAAARPAAVILREKDLSERDYTDLAADVLALCSEYSVPCILHSFADSAAHLQADALHLPISLLREMAPADRTRFRILGTSCHSLEEALEAERVGCTYTIAGHIFETDCKRGTPGRGLAFLRSVCKAVSLPVYAIGGITPQRIPAIRQAGAAGACVMSGLMSCDDPASYLNILQER